MINSKERTLPSLSPSRRTNNKANLSKIKKSMKSLNRKATTQVNFKIKIERIPSKENLSPDSISLKGILITNKNSTYLKRPKTKNNIFTRKMPRNNQFTKLSRIKSNLKTQISQKVKPIHKKRLRHSNLHNKLN